MAKVNFDPLDTFTEETRNFGGDCPNQGHAQRTPHLSRFSALAPASGIMRMMSGSCTTARVLGGTNGL